MYMKTAHFLNILLSAAVLLLVGRLVWTETSAPKEAVAPANTTWNHIMSRTSIRAYSDRAVTQEQIDTLLRAAMAAPTARNHQPWQLVVVTDKAQMKALSEVMCGDMSRALPGEASSYWIQDCSAATENLLLAAHSMGLGAVWCGVYPISERVAGVRRVLQLPDSIIPLNMVPIGWPAEHPQPKDKWMPEKVHYNRY